MADFLTHTLFGDLVGREVPMAVRRVSEQYPEAFRWGFQGPDILFFRKVWKDGGPYHLLGNKMHSEQMDELFDAMVGYIRRQESTKQDVLLSYFYGFLCHYALDSEIHPYVYALQKTGQVRNIHTTGGVLHCQIETDIDMALYERWERKPIQEFRPYDGYHLPTEQQWMIGELYETVMLEVYGEVLPADEAAHAFPDMLMVEDVLYRRGAMLGKAGRTLGMIKTEWGGIISHAKVKMPEWDALNLKKRGWRNPDEPDVLRRDSVLDIMSLAEEKALRLMNRYSEMFAKNKFEKLHYTQTFDNGNQK